MSGQHDNSICVVDVKDLSNHCICVFIEVLKWWHNSVWTGATDQETEGTFKWVVGNGDKIYPLWGPGQPNNYNNQDCMGLARSAIYHDDFCTSENVFVCEKNQNG
jgi:hypothetical protein